MKWIPGRVLNMAALGLLSGCVTWTGSAAPGSVRALLAQEKGESASASSPYFDFSWELSGDRQAAPLQVFDDGQRMWMQFSPRQGIPMLWRAGPNGDSVPVAYAHDGPYVVLDSIWPELVVRVGDAQAAVKRDSGHGLDSLRGVPSPPDATSAEQMSASVSSGVPASARQIEGPASGNHRAALSGNEDGPRRGSGTVSNPDNLQTGVPSTVADERPLPSFSVTRQDGHMRHTLARWAGQAGWVFQAEHWSVDVDIPIAGDASFELPFEQAVEALLAATELSDRPLQPCFYSNKVVRVVPYAQACDRTVAPGERT